MAEQFSKGNQQAWFHDQGHWGGFFHTYDCFQLPEFSGYFSQPRKIHVFIPRDYEVSGHHYPVVYCNDGDSIFFGDGSSGQSWQLAERLSRLYLREELPKLIVVAICPGDRRYEYSHGPNHTENGVEAYSRYLAKGVKPFIDANYRTDPQQTLLVGSSRGGLAAFYTSTQHPRQFPQVAALSPSFWVGLEKNQPQRQGLQTMFHTPLVGSALIFAATPTLTNPELRPKIYLDWGLISEEGDFYEERAKNRGYEMRELLIEHYGYQENVNLFTVEDPIGRHSEESWGARLEIVLKIFF